MTTNYYSNFDDTAFKPYQKDEFNRLGDDLCYKQAKDTANNDILKFYTTNHADLLQARENLNFFSIGVKDTLAVPNDKVDTYSSLLNGTLGSQLTNLNMRYGLGTLPVNIPFRGQVSRGDVEIEDTLRNLYTDKSKACIPNDHNFEQRSFYIFDDSLGIETPNALKSVENFQRAGEVTRFVNRYRKK